MAVRRRMVAATRRRVMSWNGAVVDLATVDVSAISFATIVSEAILEEYPTPTIVRIRGHMLCIADTTMTSGAFGMIAIGIILVTRAALVAGAVPDPITDVGSEWMWYHTSTIGETTSSSVIGREIVIDRFEVDTKAMRKVKPNEALVLVAKAVTCEGTTVANLCGIIRVLAKAS